MNHNFKNLTDSIYYNVIKKYNFKVDKFDENSITYTNNNCHLLFSAHMGEVIVYLKKTNEGKLVDPLIWANLIEKINLSGKISPLKFDPNTKLSEIVKYELAVYKTII